MHKNSNRFYDRAWQLMPLSSDLIATAGFRILECEGLRHLSVKRVQTVLFRDWLGSIVKDQEELQVLLLEKGLEPLETLALEGSSGRDRLNAFLVAYTELLRGRPGLAVLAQATIASGPERLRLFDQLLPLLKEIRIDGSKAAHAAELILLLSTAMAATTYQSETFAQRLRISIDVLLDGFATPPGSASDHVDTKQRSKCVQQGGVRARRPETREKQIRPKPPEINAREPRRAH